MHCSVFHYADNDEGYITVICLRDRYLDELKKLGWVEKPEDVKKPAKRGRKTNDNSSDDN